MCRWGQIDQSWCCGQEQMVACNIRTRLKKDFVMFITVTLAQHQLGHHRLDHGRDLWQRSRAGSGCLKALIWTPELKSIMKRLQIVSRIIVVTKRNLLQQSMHWLNFSESTTPPWARASRTQVDLKKWEERGWSSGRSLQIMVFELKCLDWCWWSSTLPTNFDPLW